MMTIYEVRDLLRRLAEEAGSIGALARERGVSRSYISDVINGRREPGLQLQKAFGLRRLERISMYEQQAAE